MATLDGKGLRIVFEHRQGSRCKVSLDGSVQAFREFFTELLPPISVVLLSARMLLPLDSSGMEGMGKPPSAAPICPTVETPYNHRPKPAIDLGQDD